MEKYCNVIQVRWCVIVHNHKDSTGAERVMQVPLDTEIGFLTSWNCWKCMVSDLTHDKTFTMMPELELCAVWMFVCLLSNEYLHKQHGWTVYYGRLMAQQAHTPTLLHMLLVTNMYPPVCAIFFNFSNWPENDETHSHINVSMYIHRTIFHFWDVKLAMEDLCCKQHS